MRFSSLFDQLRAGGYACAGFILFVAGWWAGSAFFDPLFLPSPWLTLESARELTSSGVLLQSVLASLGRIGGGWIAGAIVGVPLGLLMGRMPQVRTFATPYIQGLRYIPPIAFVGLFVVWFGAGEASKVILVFYTTVFIVVINVMAGALSVHEGLIRAARSLGATQAQVLFKIVVPCTVPFVVTGMRMALGNAFIAIAAAEMLSAQSGMGFLIWSARSMMQTDVVFVGFLMLGALGLATDRLFQTAMKYLFANYRIV